MPLGYPGHVLSEEHLTCQWNRVKRWRNRVLQFKSKSHTPDGLSEEDIDIFYSFVVNVYSLKDWIISYYKDCLKRDCKECLKIECSKIEGKIESLFNKNIYLRVCADYCNIIKHRNLDRTIRCDPNLIHFRGFDYLSQPPNSFYYIGYEFKYITSDQLEKTGIKFHQLKSYLKSRLEKFNKDNKYKNGEKKVLSEYIDISEEENMLIIVADFSDNRTDYKEVFGEYYERLRQLFSQYPHQSDWKKIELFEFVDNCFNTLKSFLIEELGSEYK